MKFASTCAVMNKSPECDEMISSAHDGIDRSSSGIEIRKENPRIGLLPPIRSMMNQITTVAALPSDSEPASIGLRFDCSIPTTNIVVFQHEASEVSSDDGSAVSDLSEDDDQFDGDISTIDYEYTQTQNSADLVQPLWPNDIASIIPLNTMLTIVKVFGPEDLEPWRKELHNLDNKQSLIRTFKRWNPHFFSWFHRKKGLWVPVLGYRGESRRRETSRNAYRRSDKP